MFVVNKFVKMDDMGTTYTVPRNYYKKVDCNAKGKLWILTRPVKRYGGYSVDGLLELDEENGEFPIGTVFYNEVPVKKTNNLCYFDCFVRASWNDLHRNIESWKIISEEIKKITNLYIGEKGEIE